MHMPTALEKVTEQRALFEGLDPSGYRPRGLTVAPIFVCRIDLWLQIYVSSFYSLVSVPSQPLAELLLP